MSNSINLNKKVPAGARINLTKNDGSQLVKFCVGANWGAIETSRGSKSVDLDLAIGLFTSTGVLLDTVYFANDEIPGASLDGDDRSGDVGGDDGKDNETISVDLSQIDTKAEYLAIVLTSYSNIDFGDIPFASARIYEGSEGVAKEVMAYFEVAKNDSFTGSKGLIMGSLYKHNGTWKFNAIGHPTKDSRIEKILDFFKSNYIR